MEMEIKNSCGNLRLGVIRHIRRTLSWIDAADVAGIDFVELRDGMWDADHDAPEWHKNATEQDLSVNGLYSRLQDGSSACITLFVRDLYRGIPRFYWLTPVVTMRIARTLAHEVGHHIIAERGYVFERGERVRPVEYEEEMAHRYAHHVTKKMKTRWYYRLADWATKDLASTHYIQGMLAWKASDHAKAAERWYESFHLDPDRNDAIYWYKRACEATTKRELPDPQAAEL